MKRLTFQMATSRPDRKTGQAGPRRPKYHIHIIQESPMGSFRLLVFLANMESWGFKFKPGEKKSRVLLGGIIFEGEASVDWFDTGLIGPDNKPRISNTIRMDIGLEYDSESFLSEKTLKNLEKDFFKKIRDAIVKPKRK